MDSSVVIHPLPLFAHAKGNLAVAEKYELAEVLPLLFIGKVKSIDESTNSIIVGWVDDVERCEKLYADLENYYKNQTNDVTELLLNGFYVVQFDNVYHRCEVLKVTRVNDPSRSGKSGLPSTSTRKLVTIRLFDLGIVKEVDECVKFFEFASEFFEDEYAYACAAKCVVDYSNVFNGNSPLGLKRIQEDDVVQVYLFSGFEPYSVFITPASSKIINHGALSTGLSESFQAQWNKLFHSQQSTAPTITTTAYLGRFEASKPRNAVVVGFESVEQVFVRDNLTSMRFILFSEVFGNIYKSPHVQQECRFHTDALFGSGSIVVYYDEDRERYLRAKVLSASTTVSVVNLVGIDYPTWKAFDVPTEKLFAPAECVANFPAFVQRIVLRHPSKHREQFFQQAELLACAVPTGSVVQVIPGGDKQPFFRILVPFADGYTADSDNILRPLEGMGPPLEVDDDDANYIEWKTAKLNIGQKQETIAEFLDRNRYPDKLPTGAVPVCLGAIRSATEIFVKTLKQKEETEALEEKLRDALQHVSSSQKFNPKHAALGVLAQGKNFKRVQILNLTSCVLMDWGSEVKIDAKNDAIFAYPTAVDNPPPAGKWYSLVKPGMVVTPEPFTIHSKNFKSFYAVFPDADSDVIRLLGVVSSGQGVDEVHDFAKIIDDEEDDDVVALIRQESDDDW